MPESTSSPRRGLVDSAAAGVSPSYSVDTSSSADRRLRFWERTVSWGQRTEGLASPSLYSIWIWKRSGVGLGGSPQHRWPLTTPPGPPAHPSSGSLGGGATAQSASRRHRRGLRLLGCGYSQDSPIPALREEQDPRAVR